MSARTPLDIELFQANRTSRSLARELGVHETQVSRWRKGRTIPEPETQARIATLLGRTAEDLWPQTQEAA